MELESRAQRHRLPLKPHVQPTSVGAEAGRKLSLDLAMPWDGVLTALENAAVLSKGTVSVVSLRQQTSDSGLVDVALSGRADSPDAVLSYVEALAAQRGVKSLQLVTQEHGEEGKGSFELALKWDAPGSRGLPMKDAQ